MNEIMDSLESSSSSRPGTSLDTPQRVYIKDMSVNNTGWRYITFKPTRILRAQNNLYIFSLLTTWKKACLNKIQIRKGWC